MSTHDDVTSVGDTEKCRQVAELLLEVYRMATRKIRKVLDTDGHNSVRWLELRVTALEMQNDLVSIAGGESYFFLLETLTEHETSAVELKGLSVEQLVELLQAGQAQKETWELLTLLHAGPTKARIPLDDRMRAAKTLLKVRDLDPNGVLIGPAAKAYWDRATKGEVCPYEEMEREMLSIMGILSHSDEKSEKAVDGPVARRRIFRKATAGAAG
jgi:hypothetical protein